MANRATPLTFIETLSGNILASTYFDNNISPAFTAINDATLGWVNGIAVDSGSANNYVLTPVFGVTSSPNPGMLIAFLPANTNTGASNLTFGTLTSQSIVDWAGNPVVPGAIQAGKLTLVTYLSGAFRLLYTTVPGVFLYNSALPSGGGAVQINCAGYSQIAIMLNAASLGNHTWTITLNGAAWGAHIDVQIRTAGAAQVFKWGGTDQAGNSFNNLRAYYPVTSTSGNLVTFQFTNLATAGDSAPNFLQYNGAVLLDSVASVTNLQFFGIYN
ncbi:MAG TPA: hypothetical protein VK673_21780 [Chthoniobacterales bacterium]|nr:hypothetical protein [Chthoniobacterales bacterium]